MPSGVSPEPGRPEPRTTPEAPSVGGRVDTAALAIGTLVNGVAAYGFIVIGTRDLGGSGFAPVSVLWTIWIGAAAAFTFPVVHWVVRSVHAHGEPYVRSHIVRLLVLAAAASGVIGAVCLLWRRSLFADPGLTYPLVAAGIPIGAVAMGIARGLLAGRGRFPASAGLSASENLIRVAGAVYASIAGWGAEAYAGILLVGFIGAFLVPDALRPRRPRRSIAERGAPVADASLGILAGLAVGTVFSQVVLSSGPVVVAALGAEPAEVTSYFDVLALYRAPFLIVLGVVVQLTALFTRWHLDGRAAPLHRAWSATVVGVPIIALAGAGAAAAVGARVHDLVFGPEVDVSSSVAATLAAGCVLAVGALAFTVMLVARGATSWIARSWATAFVAAGLLVAVVDGAPVERTATGFVAAEVLAFVLLAVGARHRARVTGPGATL